MKYYSQPAGSLKGKLNILGVQITDDGTESTVRSTLRFNSHPLFIQTFRLKASKGFFNSEWTLQAPNVKNKNLWISVLCKAKDQTSLETQQLLEIWKKQEECISCLAAIAAEQAEKEEKQNPFQTEDNDDATNEQGLICKRGVVVNCSFV